MVVFQNDCKMNLSKGGFCPLFEEGSNLIIGGSIAFENENGKLMSLEMRNLDDEEMKFNNEELTCSQFKRYKDLGYVVEVQLSAKMKSQIS